MWPFARGSVQPIKPPLELNLRPTSQSAPQLEVAFTHGQIPRDTAEQRLRNPLPPRSLIPLLSDSQFTTLSDLPIKKALVLLENGLPESVHEPQRGYISLLLYSVYQWARGQHLEINKVSVLLSIYNDAAMFCLDCPWRTQQEMYQFFKESMLNCCVNRPPNSTLIFSPDQCRSILLSFCHRFLLVLPLVRLMCLPNRRIKLSWDPASNETEIASQL